MGNEYFDNDFTTLDAYLAAWLTIRGHEPHLIDEGDKIAFHFTVDSCLYDDIADFNAGALVPASLLASTTKMLRGRIRSMKTEKGNRYDNGHRCKA